MHAGHDSESIIEEMHAGMHVAAHEHANLYVPDIRWEMGSADERILHLPSSSHGWPGPRHQNSSLS